MQVEEEHGVREGGSVGGRDLRRREGGREIRAGQAREAGGGGRREGQEGGRHKYSVPDIVMHRSKWLLAFTLY